MLRSRALLAAAMSGALVATAPVAVAGQFDYTDTSANGAWTTPTGASVVQVILQGAAGGSGASANGGSGGSGGNGANIASSIDVSAEEVLNIGLGRTGTNGSGTSGAGLGGASGFRGSGGNSGGNGGGGGGASAVQIAGTSILISGGGGGGGGANGGAGLIANPTGGSGGSGAGGYVLLTGTTTSDGGSGTRGSNGSTSAGGGGTGTTGGARGDTFPLTTAGSANTGGNGGGNLCGGGGGGGGYFGGGGGGSAPAFESTGCSGGGAGSSYMAAARTGTNRIYSDSPTGSASRAQINFIDFTTSSLGSGTVGQSYTENVVATFGASTAPDVWSVSPALPAGLTLNTATGEITGTPTESTNATYTITASYNPGGLGLIARSAISLTLVIASVPSTDTSTVGPSGTGVNAIVPLLTGTGGPWKLSVGVPALVVPASNSGTFAQYTISPALPDGLQLDPTSGIITGTARAVSPATLYTLTATNTAGSSSLAFRMGVDSQSNGGVANSMGASALARVAFSGSGNRLSRSAKQRLRVEIDELAGPVQITSEVTDPSSSEQMQRAYARGISLRKFLRVQGAEVESTIALVPQTDSTLKPGAWITSKA